jgi:hypothetical protein
VVADDLAHRRHILLVMLAATRFRYPPDQVPELVRLLRGWFASWPGIGRIVAGMTRQGFDLQLTQYDQEGWRATFYPEGARAHMGRDADTIRGMLEDWQIVEELRNGAPRIRIREEDFEVLERYT